MTNEDKKCNDLTVFSKKSPASLGGRVVHHRHQHPVLHKIIIRRLTNWTTYLSTVQ